MGAVSVRTEQRQIKMEKKQHGHCQCFFFFLTPAFSLKWLSKLIEAIKHSFY